MKAPSCHIRHHNADQAHPYFSPPAPADSMAIRGQILIIKTDGEQLPAMRPRLRLHHCALDFNSVQARFPCPCRVLMALAMCFPGVDDVHAGRHKS